MDAATWERVQELFHAAADLPPPEQRALLESSAAEAVVIAAVQRMLAADARGGSILDRGVPELAGDLLTSDALRGVSEIGPYRARGVLGEGGMGKVLLAERTDLGSLVAIKLLSNAGLSPLRLERFHAEQHMLAQLDHPGIARLYHHGRMDDGTPYFVMEYVDGAPLTEYCRTRAAGVEERLGLFRALCEAVQFAHQHAIIHRDIKPTNVLVKRDGGVRLLDFGIAKHLDGDGDPTRTGLGLMTPAYAAPEQLLGEPVGIYTDVYSLGVVLYELLAGRLPFDRSRAHAERDRIVVETVPDAPSLAARASATGATASRAAWADLDVLVLTAMQREPQRRYRSVEALIRDIDHYLRGEPLEARPDSVGYRVRKFLGRNRRAVALAAATVAIVVGLVAVFTVRIAAARDAALAQAQRTQRIQRFMTDLLTGGGQDMGPGKDLRVVTVIDQGARQARALDADPALQTDLFQTLATLYIPLGEIDSADELLRAALDKRRALYGDDSPATVETMGHLGELRAFQGRYDEAEQLFRPALEVGRRLLPARDERVTRCARGLGAVLMIRGRFDEALPILTEQVELASRENPVTERDLADATTLLARAHYNLGHYGEAEAGFERALDLDRIRTGDQRASIADDLTSLGSVQCERGSYAEAERRFREALALREQLYPRDNPQVAESLALIGRVLVQEDRLADAQAALAEAQPIFEHAFGAEHAKTASLFDELGQLARKQGRLADAEALHRREEQAFRASFGDKHYRNAIAHGHLGDVYLDREDYPAAERIYREALALLRETLPSQHPRTAAAEARLGRALVRQRRFRDAEPHSLAACQRLSQTTSRADAWHRAACDDLVAIYEALGQPAKAAAFRER